ncbi:rab GTPase-binding effector protein 1-like isoform X2 [Asterias rubens]|uniref:rab GTPase-binding effector protein 1-like isoform X2 n=1 Tax=Asterias rubens TaxID=7604 RepID=UPI0014550E29|nr:rab GTPase-binding effector protein 1-like isoform X2 [Asterias rubens]
MENQVNSVHRAAGLNIEDDVNALRQRVEELETNLRSVLQERMTQEADFAQKRAKFKEIFLTREEELIKEAELMRSERDTMQNELDELKTVAVMAETTYREEMDECRRTWKNEVGTMQAILRDAVAMTTEETALTYQQEREKLLAANEQLNKELQSFQQIMAEKSQMSGTDKDTSLLSSMTRSLRSLTGSNSPSASRDEKQPQPTTVEQQPPPPQQQPSPQQKHTPTKEEEDLENSMLKAQKDTEILRSVVVPLEREIESLKEKLQGAKVERRALEHRLKKHGLEDLGISTVDKAQSPATPPESVLSSTMSSADLDEKVRALSSVLEAEKTSRSDMELYVAVLNKQKYVMQEDNDTMREELREVCRLLEKEKQEHTNLKHTWHMANNQFLESQRLQMMDMRRMESVLTEEQQRQIVEAQRKDREREEAEQRVQAIKEQQAKHERETERLQQSAQVEQPLISSEPQDKHGRSSSLIDLNSPTTQLDSESTRPSHLGTRLLVNLSASAQNFTTPNVDPEELLQFETQGQSSSPLHRSMNEIAAHSFSDNTMYGMDAETASLSSNISLTEAQERAISGETPEGEEMRSVLASARARTEMFPSLAGKRVVSETEWTKLQEEIRIAREKLGRPCDMCSNYEDQLQSVQSREGEYKELTQSLKVELDAERESVSRERRLRIELEESLQNAAEDAQSQIGNATAMNQESEKFLTDLRQQYLREHNEMHDRLQKLMESREQIYQEVSRLQGENESLSAKRTLHMSIMSGEEFNLPSGLDELQTLCIKYREDIITVRVNAEHIEEKLRNENSFLKEQLEAEQHTKMTLEDTYQMEMDEYKEELRLLRSQKDTFEKERKLCEDAQRSLQESQDGKKTIEAKSREVISALQAQVAELLQLKSKLETEARESRNKLQSLQVELDNSEAVQRDFVRLSQSLQVQLENIRQKDNEVRWEHEEDVEQCKGCKSPFGSQKKKKHHCMHCGKVFCPECLNHNVESGPRKRRMPVCNICHTLLVNESAPYFSKEAPET